MWGVAGHFRGSVQDSSVLLLWACGEAKHHDRGHMVEEICLGSKKMEGSISRNAMPLVT